MNNFFNFLSISFFLFLLPPFVYLFTLAIGSTHTRKENKLAAIEPTNRFTIIIPAHNEESVIWETINQIRSLDYPFDLFKIYVVADHCSDRTAKLAREAGATVFERNEGTRGMKSDAISWLFQKNTLKNSANAVVIFDADTRVDKNFLTYMNERLAQGYQVIQGQHIISNYKDGWFPSLIWAMFIIDNRFQNLGRTNLGLSAKNMGDSICFRADVLKMFNISAGLTEDYQLRQQLLMEGIKIAYEPRAIGYGEAPKTWHQAEAQRVRWLKGTCDARQKYGTRLLAECVKHPNLALLDGALQAYLPSYSSLTMLSIFSLAIQILFNIITRALVHPSLIIAWGMFSMLLFCYPFWGLTLEHAPRRAFLVILSGPIFIFWRSWLAVMSRFGRKKITWVRTTHGLGKQD